jgi:cytochrome P450
MRTPGSASVAPGPRGGLVMGNLKEYKRDPIGMLLRLRLEYGDIVRNRLGPFVTHALAHPDHIKYVLQTNASNYVRGRFYERFKLFFGYGLLTTDGDFWLRHRHIAQPLFHKRQVDTLSEMITAPVSEMLERWYGYAEARQPIDVVPEMMRLSLRVLGKAIFNLDIARHADKVGPAVRLGLEAMMPQGNLNDFIPFWVPTPLNWRIRRARRVLHDIIDQVIEDHRTGRSEGGDLISLLLSAKDPETGAALHQQEVRDEVMTVFLAGHETTGSGLAWCLYALSKHPDVMRRLRAELGQVLGERAPGAADVQRLPYLSMVVDESLRMYPPIWGYTRDAIEDDEVGGYRIPAGSSIFVSPYVTHRHPEFWENPEAFDPERFAAENAGARPRFAYFPFGGGPRQCIGIHMAKLQMQLAIGAIVQRFDLHAVPGHTVKYGALVSLRPANGILLSLHPCKPRLGARVQIDSRPQLQSPTPETRSQGCPVSHLHEVQASTHE